MRKLLLICIVLGFAAAALQSRAQESTVGPVNREYTIRFLANGTIEAPFAVNTRGTRTGGIQEAINAWTNHTVGANGPLASTLNLKFSGVSYFYTNPIVISLTYESCVKIVGDGCQNSMLVFAGTNTGVDCFRIQSATTNGGYLQGYSAFIRDIGFSSTTNTTNVLLHVAAASHAEFDHVNFTAWDIREDIVNFGAGSTLTPVGDFLATPNRGLVGLVLDGAQGYDQGNEIHDCFFAGLATGIFTDVDHVESHGLLGILIGISGDILFGVGNQWPDTSYYSLGAMVVAKGGKERKWYGTHCYAANVGFAALAATTADLLDHPSFETCYNGVITDATNLLAACAPIVRNPEINEFGTPAANIAFWDAKWMTNGAGHYGVSNAVAPGAIVEAYVTPKFALGATKMNYSYLRIGGTNLITVDTNLNTFVRGLSVGAGAAAGVSVLTNTIYTNVTINPAAATAASFSDTAISTPHGTTFNGGTLKSNDIVVVNVPAISQTNGVWYSWISNNGAAANTIYLRYVNIQGTTVDPAQGIFNVELRQYK